jgi:hypothetical protein
VPVESRSFTEFFLSTAEKFKTTQHHAEHSAERIENANALESCAGGPK